MDNWLANIVGDVDSLHVEIDNLNDPLVGFCFIRSIDMVIWDEQKDTRAQAWGCLGASQEYVQEDTII
jgi:hypothetical protein